MAKRPTVIRAEKVAAVGDLADVLSRSAMTVLADYRGLTVAQFADLRRQLRPGRVQLRVVKNTLARLAAQRAHREALLPALVGPTAIVFSYDDAAAMAKVLSDTIRVQRLPMQIKGALLGDRLLPPADVARLGDLPSRDVLIGQVIGAAQSPITGLVSVLSGTLQSLVGVLDARRQQLEESAAS